MSEVKRDYKIGYGKPPRGRPFQKGQSGNPRGPRRKDLSSLLTAALNEPVYATIDGKRRKITKREAIVKQMVNESAGANLRATKMLFDMMKEVEQKAGTAGPPEPAFCSTSFIMSNSILVARRLAPADSLTICLTIASRLVILRRLPSIVAQTGSFNAAVNSADKSL